MIWKIYKLMVVILVQYGVDACVGRRSSERNDLLTQVNRLSRIIICIREYYGLHPTFAATTYGSLDLYLKQRLSEQEWVLLNKLRVVKSTQSSCAPSTVLDIA